MSDDKLKNVVVTPIGFISFPYLAKPDVGRTNSSGKYTAQLFIPKDVFKVEGQKLLQVVLELGRTLKGPNATLRDFKHTIYDVDALTPEKKAKLHEAVRSGYIQINCASTRAPIVKDAKQNIMALQDIERISGGDVCRFVVGAYTYKQQGGGVALGLNVVQYKEKGPVAFGGGGAGVELLTDLEVKMEDVPASDLVGGISAAPAPAADPLGL